MSDLLGFAVSRRQSRAALLAPWFNGGSIDIYAGTRPADADTAIGAQVLLCTIVLPDPAGAAANGIWTADPLPDPALILADGEAAWARVRDALDVTICDLDVGLSGSGAALTLDSLILIIGATVAVTALQIIEG